MDDHKPDSVWNAILAALLDIKAQQAQIIALLNHLKVY